MQRNQTLMTVLALASHVAFAADPAQDDAMLKLANNAGCMTCHQVELGGKGPGGLAPIGPAWRDVSGLAMPPDKVIIGEADTKKLVARNLSLDAPKR